MPARHAKPRPARRRAATTLGLSALIGGGLAVAAETADAAVATLDVQGSQDVPLGEQIFATALIAGRTDPPAGAPQVTFTLYGPNDPTCAAPNPPTFPVAVPGTDSAVNVASTPPYVPAVPGTYRWTASYSGDTGNTAPPVTCADADVTEVLPAVSALTTAASPGFTIGAQPGTLTDTATVAGQNPTGTVTFTLYGPNDDNCSGTAAFGPVPVALGQGQAVSPPYVPQLAGAYRWVASYSGDGNNAPASSPCNAPGETVTVARATPTLATTAAADLAAGRLGDSATVAGRVLPQSGGTVTFRAYGPTDPTCAGQPVFTSTKPLPANTHTVSSDTFAPTQPGTYRWVASYSGDGNNLPASGACGDPTETTAVSAVPQKPGPNDPDPNDPGPDPDGETCLGYEATIVRGNGNNTITGTSGRDVIVAGGGNDIVYGNGGDDVICGGDGDDAIDGGDGSDQLYGGDDNDTITGGAGGDILLGGADADDLRGGSGNDAIAGNGGDDFLDGGSGTDQCQGGAGSDVTTSCS